MKLHETTTFITCLILPNNKCCKNAKCLIEIYNCFTHQDGNFLAVLNARTSQFILRIAHFNDLKVISKLFIFIEESFCLFAKNWKENWIFTDCFKHVFHDSKYI